MWTPIYIEDQSNMECNATRLTLVSRKEGALADHQYGDPIIIIIIIIIINIESSVQGWEIVRTLYEFEDPKPHTTNPWKEE